MNVESNYRFLIAKLDEFIRKYYLNQLLKGLIYIFAISLALFLIITLSESFFRFSTGIRAFLFWGYIVTVAILSYRYVTNPLFHYYKLGGTISHEKAATIIGDHFNEVSDKLLNILQLKKLTSSVSKSLVEASIDQKIEKLKPVPLMNAIDLSANKKYLKYALVPLLFFVALFFSSPDIITNSTKRLINNNTYFSEPAPFTFKIKNEDLDVLQYEDLLIEVSTEGKVVPRDMFIEFNEQRYKLKKLIGNSFEYRLTNVQKDIEFLLSAEGHHSRDYLVNVLPKPSIINFDVSLQYPSYIGRQDESMHNTGDLIVPEGTKASWLFMTKNTEEIAINFMDSLHIAQQKGKESFSFRQRLHTSSGYKIFVSNENVKRADSISYIINVVPDRYPTIRVDQNQDSMNLKYLFFIGNATDDYGITDLNFKYKKYVENRESKELSIPIAFKNLSKQVGFSHYWNVSPFDLNPGDRIVYYFEVWDNDGVNGRKSTRSNMMSYELPTVDEYEKIADKTNQDIKDELSTSMKEAKDLKNKLQKLQDELLSKKDMNWEDKEKIKDLMKKHEELKNEVESIKDKFEKNLAQQSEFKTVNESIADKQKKLQELFDKILPEELREQFEKLESMLDKMNKEQMLKEMEQFEMSEEQLEKELDRMLALFKELEFEQKLTDIIDKLDKLAEKQEELSDETAESKKDDAENLKEEQEKLKDEFCKIKEDISDLEKTNKELDKPKDLEKTTDSQEQVDQKQQESSESLGDQKMKKASKEQKEASDKMKEMSKQMQAMQSKMAKDQLEIDIRAIRQILENLVKLSFDEEELLKEVKTTNINNRKYVELVQQQYKLKDDAKIIEDSLIALSKRVFSIASYVAEQINDVNKNLKRGIEYLEDRKTGQASSRQQYVMTAVNNLALMLSEAMEQMQNQMAQSMPGSQNCQKPGQGKAGQIPNLAKLQQQLNKQIQEMEKSMKEGRQKPGGKGMSKELAKAAARQAAIRDALRKISNEENKDGKGSLGNLEEIRKQMENTETDLVNKRLTQEMIKRQQKILTRLLEAADAERQREMEKKRISETAVENEREMPPSVVEYLKKREAEIEYYKTIPPSLKPFYRDLVEDYFKAISY